MERAGPSHTDTCSSDPTTTEPRPDLNHTQPIPDHADTDTGAPSQSEPLCGTDANSADHVGPCDDLSGTTDSEPAAEKPQHPCDTRKEENEEHKPEGACSSNPTANEHPAKRRACRKRKKCLFTVQAVNSNGTTEIGTGSGAVSFSCESDTQTHTQSLCLYEI